MADDWVGIGYPENLATKKSFLAGVKSGQLGNPIIGFGPMDVKVLGNVAVVHGTYTATGTAKFIYMDVFVKRHGKWVVVRSQLGPCLNAKYCQPD
jgi:hypothetical protein